MEELHEIAEAYFAVASDDVKEKARNFFNEMDSNFDNKVSLHEFLEFMRQESYQELRSSDLFKKLCRRDGENLEFMDVMTLYYIIRSGRPFCERCNEFIKNTYFCCIQCFHSSKRSYCLCIKCFKAKKYSHHPCHQFLDNFTLLEVKRYDALKWAAVPNQVSSSRKRKRSDQKKNDGELGPAKQTLPRHRYSTRSKKPSSGSDRKNDGETSLAPVPVKQTSSLFKKFKKFIRGSDRKNDGETSLALVPAEQEKLQKRQVALKAFETTLAVASHAATIASLCSIL